MTACGRNKRGDCGRCDRTLDFDFTMAFQPIVDVDQLAIIGYEALVRGVNGESAGAILAQVEEHNIYQFDQAARVRALELAHQQELSGLLSINFMPNAVYEPRACIRATLDKAQELGWPAERLSFELVETEYTHDRTHLQRVVSVYGGMGFSTALDDFGSGYANLDLLVDLDPTFIKIDRSLIAGVEQSARQAAIVCTVIRMAEDIGITVIAEGVETVGEARWLYDHDVVKHQGYLYAHPAVDAVKALDTTTMAHIRGGAGNPD